MCIFLIKPGFVTGLTGNFNSANGTRREQHLLFLPLSTVQTKKCCGQSGCTLFPTCFCVHAIKKAFAAHAEVFSENLPHFNIEGKLDFGLKNKKLKNTAALAPGQFSSNKMLVHSCCHSNNV